jgi:hypothetical protein
LRSSGALRCVGDRCRETLGVDAGHGDPKGLALATASAAAISVGLI